MSCYDTQKLDEFGVLPAVGRGVDMIKAGLKQKLQPSRWMSHQ